MHNQPICIIPARGGSKRIPRKNIAPIGGAPMISYPIQKALKSQVFDRVIVSTEDEEIKGIATHYGAEVISRPASLATDQSMEIDVYEHVLDQLKKNDAIEPTFFCALYPTAIFLDASDFEKSYNVVQNATDADALMGVSEYAIHPFKALHKNETGFLEMVHPKECLERSQTYPQYVASNGTFYWLRTAAYRKQKTYYQPNLLPYILPASKALDIDTPDDLKRAGAMMVLNQNTGGSQ